MGPKKIIALALIYWSFPLEFFIVATEHFNARSGPFGGVAHR